MLLLFFCLLVCSMLLQILYQTIAFSSLFLKTGNDAITQVLQAFIFTIGLFLICCLGFYLYTGKIGYILGAKKKFIIDLPIILLGNFAGAALFGYVFYFLIQSGNITVVSDKDTVGYYDMNSTIEVK